jgi:hypothetical protein
MSAKRNFRWSWLFVLLFLPAMGHAKSASYRYDTVHSQILFSISHNGYSRPFGLLHIARGWLRFDPSHWSRSATVLDIDLAGLDMGDADWNKAVLKPAFLDLAGARYAHFVSTSVERKDKDPARQAYPARHHPPGRHRLHPEPAGPDHLRPAYRGGIFRHSHPRSRRLRHDRLSQLDRPAGDHLAANRGHPRRPCHP